MRQAVERTTEAVRVLARLSRVVEATCTAGDLSLPQYRLLVLLATRPQRFRALCDRAAIRPPTLTALVDSLEAKGLVRRAAVEGDRRAQQVELTDAGLAALHSTEAAVAERLRPLLDASGRGDDVVDGLTALGTAMDEAFDAWLAEQAHQ